MISIIIPTYNKAHRLKITLQGLSWLKILEPVELIIVNDGSTDRTAEEIEGALFSGMLSPFSRVEYIETVNAGRASARNRGVEASRGDLFLFIDDDVIVEPDFVSAHKKCHEQINTVVHGKIFSLPYMKFFDNPVTGELYNGDYAKGPLSSKILNNYQNFSNMKKHYLLKNRKTSKFESDIYTVFKLTEEEDINFRWVGTVGGNLSIPRNLFEQVGGFDEKFGIQWGCEDLEFGYRLSKKNVRFIYSEHAINYHINHYREDYEKQHKINMDYFISKSKQDHIKLLSKYFENKISIIEWMEMAISTGGN